jgi:hypothetical protein
VCPCPMSRLRWTGALEGGGTDPPLRLTSRNLSNLLYVYIRWYFNVCIFIRGCR